MEDRQDWHIDRGISWGHIVTTATAVLAIIIWTLQLDTKINVNSTRIDSAERAILDMNTDNRDQYGEIIRRLERLDKKIEENTR